jgi:type II secretory pathway pseudopilin PulG
MSVVKHSMGRWRPARNAFTVKHLPAPSQQADDVLNKTAGAQPLQTVVDPPGWPSRMHVNMRPVSGRFTGFTLIEMMLIVGIAAVLTGAALPAAGAGMSVLSVVSAGQQVARTIRLARARAIGRNTDVVVHFDLSEQLFMIGAADGDEPEGLGRLPRGVTLERAPDIRFNALGRPAAPVTISLTNREGFVRTIVVSASGRVRLE